MKTLCLLLGTACLLMWSTRVDCQTIPFDSDRWDIKARESKTVEHLGRQALYLKGGLATIKDSNFLDGVIDFDIAFSSERGFMGGVWRVQDEANYEEFYVRPHQSGNPDANQYTPVFNGVAGWQLYAGEGYCAPTVYEFNQWTHVRILVSGKNAEIYIKDMNTPAVVVSELKREVKAGRVGLSVGNFAPAYYSNFSFSPSKPPTLKGQPKPEEQAPAGTVMSWLVSNVFDAKTLDDKYELSKSDTDALKWQRLNCEQTGLANLARLNGVREANTVFAKVTIQAERSTVKKVKLAFSDIVKAYFNGQLMFRGSDVYQSRDYRYLGTIGYFDELYLPLKAGDNELWLAVTENFGGWGIKAMFDDTSGIVIK